MAVHQVDYVQILNNILGATDPTKQLNLSLSNITSGTTCTLNVPNANTTIVGDTATQTLTNKTLTLPIISTISNTGTLTLPTITDTLVARTTTDTLTNKTIIDPTNNVTANGLRTTTTTVAVSTATAPTTGQVLTATSTTAANWQTPGGYDIYWNNAGTVSTPNITSLKQWFGISTSASGIATFNVTVDGTTTGAAIFPTLAVNIHVFQTSAQSNTTSNTAVPIASIENVTNNKIVAVNVKTGASGGILIGGTYYGFSNAPDGCIVYLSIIGP